MNTKEKLAQALKEACQTQKLDQIKIQNLTQMAGINRQTFYYHFKNIEELFSWVYVNEALVHLRIDFSGKRGAWNPDYRDLPGNAVYQCHVRREAPLSSGSAR